MIGISYTVKLSNRRTYEHLNQNLPYFGKFVDLIIPTKTPSV